MILIQRVQQGLSYRQRVDNPQLACGIEERDPKLSNA
jgi:hypothetical protein